ncbi:pentapeptide repeat-containing protein [Aureispira anguillae]|uniref:Pentapeptide repeat-containing protein n=1 Tax=Aureispira anguillae TaxID=2864201 RepID=A0A916DVG2_9BACT|nr:pentapeptide repeat-containing protein [Aureispira anguillae]BDS13106.1 pentapeptide repeat-containing protein [Aureispira anguillae]
MNELFNIFYSPKGRISRLWYLGTSLIVLSIFFLSPYPLIIDLVQHWKLLSVKETQLLLLSIIIGGMIYSSWIIVSLKRIKDRNYNLKWRYFLLLLFLFILILVVSAVYNHFMISIIVHLLATSYLLSLESYSTANNNGPPFRFVFPWIGIDDKDKNTALLEKIENYELYVKENGLKGENANFAQDDFSGMMLLNRNFTGANLSAANFDGANLHNCIFKNAIIKNASFRAADLSHTDFTNCKGSQEAIFARASLEGSNLTDDLVDPETLVQIGELAKITKPIFIGLLSACIYSWITIATIQDIAIISDSREVVLPIIQVKIAVSGFFFITPVILYFIFLYFNLYLRKLWKEVSSLPFKLQNGKEAITKVYPWLLISIGNSNFIDETTPYSSFKRIEIIICFLLAWWVVPLTMGIFWIDSLVRHDWWMASFLICMLILSVSTALIYQINSLSVLYRKQLSKGSPWKPAIILGLLVSCCVLYTYNGMVGIQQPKYTANLERAFLVPIPSGYIASTDKEKYKDIIGPNLSGCDLRFAKARGVFGVQSIFVGANMEGIILKNSCLTKADFRGVQADSADFSYADLSMSIFGGISIDSVSFGQKKIKERNYKAKKRINNLRKFSRGAKLKGANLSSIKADGVNFIGIELNSVNLSRAKLRRANFWGAELIEADFRYAKLERVYFSYAQADFANFSYTQADSADFSYAQVDSANFWGAELRGANFSSAQANLADFSSTQLENANFWGAELREANFSYTQANSAYFSSAELIEADFRYAQAGSAYFSSAKLGEADFSSAQADFAYFSYAQADSACFSSAQLRRADFSSTQLKGADFSSAELGGANFSSSRLERANFWGANLEGTNLTNATLDSGFVHITAWLDSLETWNVVGIKELIKTYKIDTVKNYRSWDKEKKYPRYYIKRRESTEDN